MYRRIRKKERTFIEEDILYHHLRLFLDSYAMKRFCKFPSSTLIAKLFSLG